MKTITKIFEDAFKKRNERVYPYLYVAIDLHGTILTPDKCTLFQSADGADKPSECQCSIGVKDSAPYLYAYETLKLISREFPWIKLILWTSTKEADAAKYVLDLFATEGIKFWSINENPDFKGNAYADFSKKFCFDIVLDDKGGFDPNRDWFELFNSLRYMKTNVEKKETPYERAIADANKLGFTEDVTDEYCNNDDFVAVAKKLIKKYMPAWKELAK